MIKIEDKTKCCGCNACASRCPKQCITLQEDAEGFRYPVIDMALCIDCGVCERVCPVIHPGEERTPLQAFAAVNPNETIRMQSSSGGVFTILAEQIIEEGGVVFGAAFDDNWEVHHTYTETKEGLEVFRGSKYLQSRIESAYQEAEHFLKDGRKVLFSGSPCQVAGLKCFLRKSYDNLLAVDFICHGVPSPKVWRKYLEENFSAQRADAGKNSVLSSSINKVPVITGIAFRDKTLTGWKKYSFVVRGKSASKADKNTVLLSGIFYENQYMQAFLNDLILRPSCYACPSKKGQSGSDITVADFWGIEHVLPDLDDDKGVSLLLAHTDKGKEFISSHVPNCVLVDAAQSLNHNTAFYKSVSVHPNRTYFFKRLDKMSLSRLIVCSLRPSLKVRVKNKIKKLVHKTFSR